MGLHSPKSPRADGDLLLFLAQVFSPLTLARLHGSRPAERHAHGPSGRINRRRIASTVCTYRFFFWPPSVCAERLCRPVVPTGCADPSLAAAECELGRGRRPARRSHQAACAARTTQASALAGQDTVRHTPPNPSVPHGRPLPMLHRHHMLPRPPPRRHRSPVLMLHARTPR